MENTNGIVPVMDMNQNYGGWGGGSCFVWIILLFALMNGGLWGNRNQGYDIAATYNAQAQTERAISASNYEHSLRGAVTSLGNGIADLGYANLNGQNAIQRDILGQSNMLQRDILAGHSNLQRDILSGNNLIQRDILADTNLVQRDIMQGNYALDKSITGAGNNLAQAIAENRFAQQNCCCEVKRAIDGVNFNNAQNLAQIMATIKADGDETRKLIVANQMQDLRDRLADRDRDLQTAQFALSQQVQNQQIIGAVRPFPVPAYPVGSPYGTNACNCTCGAYNG